MISRILSAFAAVFVVSSALASPVEGMWPSEARGAIQPRPKWIIVVPVTRDASGTITAWNRSDPWIRKWVVPKRVGDGIRTVTVTGDADDVRGVSGDQFDNMDSSALRRLTSKYGAPAIAVVVSGTDGNAAVAAWTPGHQASWEVTRDGEDPKEGAMRILGDLFSGAAAQSGRIRITGVRTIDGIDQYRLEGKDPEAIEALRHNRGIEIVEAMDVGGRPTAIVRVTNGRLIEDVIGDLPPREQMTPVSIPSAPVAAMDDPID